MADCLNCTDQLSLEDILRLVLACDESGSVSWRIYQVESCDEECIECTDNTYSLEDLLRRSLYCDEDGVWYLKVCIPS